MRAAWLLAHPATPEQSAELAGAGFDVVAMPAELRARLANTDTPADWYRLAMDLHWAVTEDGPFCEAVVGPVGAPPFWAAAVSAFEEAQHRETDPVHILYALSARDSREETQPDGSIRKTAVFRHCGFYDREGRTAGEIADQIKAHRLAAAVGDSRDNA